VAPTCLVDSYAASTRELERMHLSIRSSGVGRALTSALQTAIIVSGESLPACVFRNVVLGIV
jgi:hypothetical protein